MGDYLALAVGLIVFSAFGGFLAMAFVSNNRVAGPYQEVTHALHDFHRNHIHLAIQQSDISQAFLMMRARLDNIDAIFRRIEKDRKRPPVRHISRNTSRQRRRSGVRCAQSFLNRAIAVAERTRAERNLVAAQDHITQLLAQRNRTEDGVAQLGDVIVALEARVAQLENQSRPKLTSPTRPHHTTPTMKNTMVITPNRNRLSPITSMIAIEPVESALVSDAKFIPKIVDLELEFAKITNTKEDLEKRVEVSRDQIACLQNQSVVMEGRHGEEIASLNEDLKRVKGEYRKLSNSPPNVRKQAEEEREKSLRAQFDEEKDISEKSHERSQKLLQAELDAAEKKLADALSKLSKLETSQQESLQRQEQEKTTMSSYYKEEHVKLQHKLDDSEKTLLEVSSEQRKLETELQQSKAALQAAWDDPYGLLSDEQRQQLAYYSSLVTVLYGDGTALNPGLEAELHVATTALDNAQIVEGDLQREISELINTNMTLKLELEGLRESKANEVALAKQPSTPISIPKSPESINTDTTAPAKSLEDSDNTITCVGYVLDEGEKLINKTCRACERLVALPHWQRGDGLWVAKWGAHMKTCSHKQESNKRSPIKGPDENTTSVAIVNSSPERDGLQEKNDLPNTKFKHVWVRPPTYASEPTPRSVQGSKQCNNCGSWLDWDTMFAKETFGLHVSMCQEIVCRNEGCGDVMSKEHFSKEHQQVCEKRTVDERKTHSFTEAATLVPKRQDTLDIFTADGTARKSAQRASPESTSNGFTIENNQRGTQEDLKPEKGRRRCGLQGSSIWAAS